MRRRISLQLSAGLLRVTPEFSSVPSLSSSRGPPLPQWGREPVSALTHEQRHNLATLKYKVRRGLLIQLPTSRSGVPNLEGRLKPGASLGGESVRSRHIAEPPPGLPGIRLSNYQPRLLTALPREDQSRSIAAFSAPSTSRRNSDGRVPAFLVNLARSSVVT